MPHGRLTDAEDIELVDEDFKNPRWRQAAEEMLDFWEQGHRTFVEFEEVGEWSRSHYQNVFNEHFIAVRDGDTEPSDLEALLPGESEIDAGEYPAGFKDGFSAGIEWALEHPTLIVQLSRER